jgi:hypothetical protein
MNPININGFTTFDWVKPNPFRRQFQLWSRKDLVGTLSFAKEDDHLALVETADGSWLFRETRYLIMRISIWTQKHDYVAAIEINKSGKGHLRFLDGREYRWDYKDHMQMDWIFTDNLGGMILCFKPAFGRGKIRGKLEVSPEASGILELPMLCMLGWNIILFLSE